MADNVFIALQNCAAGQMLVVPNHDVDCPPELALSEVQRIVISDLANNQAIYPVDWTVTGAGGWADVLDNTVASGKCHYFYGKGSLAQADPEETLRAANRKSYGESQYTLTFSIDSSEQQVYDQLQFFESSPANLRLWFETIGGYLFGSPTGIICNIKRTPMNLAEGENAKEIYQIILGWKSRMRPIRIASPLP